MELVDIMILVCGLVRFECKGLVEPPITPITPISHKSTLHPAGLPRVIITELDLQSQNIRTAPVRRCVVEVVVLSI